MTPHEFSPAMALWNHRHAIHERRARFIAIHDAIGYRVDLDLPQLAQWFAAAMEFKPDLILELGRHYGNSTCTFVEAANALSSCRVVSLCLTDDWKTHSWPRVSKVVPPGWNLSLDARVANILAVDYDEILGNSKRVLVLWDAHGYAVAECVLSRILPAIRERAHLVLMHDICDTRFGDWDLGYGGQRLWKGGETIEGGILLGYFYSYVEQAISAMDFTSRNGLTLHTYGESVHEQLTEPERVEIATYLSNFYSPKSLWAWLSLNELPIDFNVSYPQPAPAGSNEFDVHGPLSASKESIDMLQATIRHMEGSPFWKLRGALQWLKPLVDPMRNRFFGPR
jgi:hypothetical protein